jgi:hypothetical protein
MNRRGFLAGMLAACAAPAIVKASSIMRVVPIVVSRNPLFCGEIGQMSGIRIYREGLVEPTIGAVRQLKLADIDRIWAMMERIQPVDDNYYWTMKPEYAREWQRALRGTA